MALSAQERRDRKLIRATAFVAALVLVGSIAYGGAPGYVRIIMAVLMVLWLAACWLMLRGLAVGQEPGNGP